jgi:branched-chain amino acid transport system permease protein
VLGMVLFVYAQANFNFGGNLHLYTGIALIVVLVFFPGGLTGTAQTLVRRLKRRGAGPGGRARKDGSA